MNKPPHVPLSRSIWNLLLGSLFGGIIGCPIGALSFTLWEFLYDRIAFFSIGFGFLGIVYVPLIGGFAGSLFGALVSGVIVSVQRYRAAKAVPKRP